MNPNDTRTETASSHTTTPSRAVTVWDWLPVTIRNREGQVYEDFSVATKSRLVTVRAPFPTDFASIPRLLTWAFPRTGWWLAPAIMHDQLYAYKSVPRAEADRLFYEALCIMRDESGGAVGLLSIPGGHAPVRMTINHILNQPVPLIFYIGVRIGGGSHY
jgi:hypothetical protein